MYFVSFRFSSFVFPKENDGCTGMQNRWLPEQDHLQGTVQLPPEETVLGGWLHQQSVRTRRLHETWGNGSGEMKCALLSGRYFRRIFEHHRTLPTSNPRPPPLRVLLLAF